MVFRKPRRNNCLYNARASEQSARVVPDRYWAGAEYGDRYMYIDHTVHTNSMLYVLYTVCILAIQAVCRLYVTNYLLHSYTKIKNSPDLYSNQCTHSLRVHLHSIVHRCRRELQCTDLFISRYSCLKLVLLVSVRVLSKIIMCRLYIQTKLMGGK